MALPTSGQLSINDIQIELGKTTGAADASLRGLADLAGFPAGDVSIGRFYGYSASETITVSWGAETITLDGPWNYQRYRLATRTGQSSTTITLNFNYSLFYESYDDEIEFDIGWSINNTTAYSTGVEEIVAVTSDTGTVTGSFSIPGITASDDVYVWLAVSYLNSNGEAAATFDINITGGTVTTGSGTVTASGTTQWLWDHYF